MRSEQRGGGVAVRVELGRRHGKSLGQLRREVGVALGGKAVEGLCESGRPVRGKRKLLQPGSGVLVKSLECVGGLAGAVRIDRATLVVENLLHPEAGHRAVEHAEEGQMVHLSGACRELDDRGGLLEDLPPRSSTKWLWVATKAKAMERGVRYGA